jgi:hypothetical protein
MYGLVSCVSPPPHPTPPTNPPHPTPRPVSLTADTTRVAAVNFSGIPVTIREAGDPYLFLLDATAGSLDFGVDGGLEAEA